MTSFVFSVLFYGSEVWLHRNLSFSLKQRIRSVHYRALRLVHGRTRTRAEIDQISQRATPDKWADYSLAKQLITIVNNCQPSRLYDMILSQSYLERRTPGQLFTYDASIKRIGRQTLSNRLALVSKVIKFPWLDITTDEMRRNLKKTFFKYVITQPYRSIDHTTGVVRFFPPVEH